MREVTIRRTLVVALCTSGVVALWVVADRSASPPDATSQPVPVPPRTSPVAVPASYATTFSPPAGPTGVRPDPDRAGGGTSRVVPATADGTPARAGRRHRPDRRPPARVTAVRVLANSHESITVSWAAVHDRSGIAYYQATLNGIPAGETAGRQLTVDWFNDDMSTHFVQIAAVDGAGNHGRFSTPLMVTRPAEPSTSPTAAPSETAPPDPPDPSAPPTTADPQPSTGTGPSGAASPTPTASARVDPSARPRASGQVTQPSPVPSGTAGTLEHRAGGGQHAGR